MWARLNSPLLGIPRSPPTPDGSVEPSAGPSPCRNRSEHRYCTPYAAKIVWNSFRRTHGGRYSHHSGVPCVTEKREREAAMVLLESRTVCPAPPCAYVQSGVGERCAFLVRRKAVPTGCPECVRACRCAPRYCLLFMCLPQSRPRQPQRRNRVVSYMSALENR